MKIIFLLAVFCFVPAIIFSQENTGKKTYLVSSGIQKTKISSAGLLQEKKEIIFTAKPEYIRPEKKTGDEVETNNNAAKTFSAEPQKLPAAANLPKQAEK
jgi:hypothetical protein